MSATMRAVSASKESTCFNNDMEKDHELKKENNHNSSCNGDQVQDHVGGNGDDHEEDDSKLMTVKESLDLGPQVSLKEQLEKDKDDESLRRWKEQLLGSVAMSSVEECKEAEVKVLSLSIASKGRPDIVVTMPFCKNSKKSLFTLKEGSHYQPKLAFTVSNNIVSGLTYSYTVWKTGIKVDHTKIMLGTYSPRQEPYIYEFQQDTTPSGIFVRGSYSVRTKIVDDDGKCYLDVNYCFEIQKKWASQS